MAVYTFSCLDGHTCGNPVRLVLGGGPRLEGATMLERRAHPERPARDIFVQCTLVVRDSCGTRTA